MIAALALALVDLQVRSLSLPSASDKPIRIEVPAGQTTRILFPEAASAIKYSPGAREHLGLRLAAAQPLALIVLAPPRHPARGTVDFQGPTLRLVLDVVTADHGVGSEIHLSTQKNETAQLIPGPTPSPSPGRPEATEAATHKSEPLAADASVKAPPAEDAKGHEPSSTTPSAQPSHPVTAATEISPLSAPPPARTVRPQPERSAVDLEAFLAAEASRIDRVEGLPGQRRCTLAFVHAPKTEGDSRLWLKFYLAGGGSDRVEGVAASWGTAGPLLAQAMGKDLMVVVEVPATDARAKHAWLELRFATAGRYRFTSLTSPTVGRSFKKLFGIGH